MEFVVSWDFGQGKPCGFAWEVGGASAGLIGGSAAHRVFVPFLSGRPVGRFMEGLVGLPFGRVPSPAPLDRGRWFSSERSSVVRAPKPPSRRFSVASRKPRKILRPTSSHSTRRSTRSGLSSYRTRPPGNRHRLRILPTDRIRIPRPPHPTVCRSRRSSRQPRFRDKSCIRAHLPRSIARRRRR